MKRSGFIGTVAGAIALAAAPLKALAASKLAQGFYAGDEFLGGSSTAWWFTNNPGNQYEAFTTSTYVASKFVSITKYVDSHGHVYDFTMNYPAVRSYVNLTPADSITITSKCTRDYPDCRAFPQEILVNTSRTEGATITAENNMRYYGDNAVPYGTTWTINASHRCPSPTRVGKRRLQARSL